MTTITFASGKGGAGRTTGSLALAGVLAQRYRVGLLDLDPDAYATTMGLGQLESPTPLTAEPIPISHRVLKPGGLLLFPGGETIDEATGPLIAEHIERAQRMVDVLVIDTPPDRRRATVREALRAASVIVIPLSPEFQHLSGLEKLHATARALGTAAPVCTLLSRWESKTILAREVQAGHVSRRPGDTISSIIPKDQKAAEAPAAGLPVTLYAPRSNASLAYRIATCEIAALAGLSFQEAR